MAVRFQSAFQRGAFQITAFQIFVDDGGGGKGRGREFVSLTDYKYTKRAKKKKKRLLQKYSKLIDKASIEEQKELLGVLNPYIQTQNIETGVSTQSLLGQLQQIEISLLLAENSVISLIIAILDRIATRLRIKQQQEEEELLLLLLLTD